MEYPKGVLENERGIIRKDGIYFSTPSVFARQNLFYLMWGARYSCSFPYCVSREENEFHAFIFFYVKDGKMEYTYRGKIFTAKAGDVVLLDCSYAHTYRVKQMAEFYWFHFQGNITKQYAERLWETCGAHFPEKKEMERYFIHIQYMLEKNSFADDMISVCIHRMLACLSAADENGAELSNEVLKAKLYIEMNYQQDIHMDDIARQVLLSKFYFSRIFKKETGRSPYLYLTEYRIRQAKYLLSGSDELISDIAWKCGFRSTAVFSRAFRNETGLSPWQFRKLNL